MRYKLIENSSNDIGNIVKTIFNNRGIINYNEYMNLTDNVLIPFSKLDNIDIAVKCLLKHLENNNNINIIVDCDTDGNTSAAILYKYIKLIYPNSNLTYSIHQNKEHGIKDIIIPEDTSLVLIPDAGSNEVEQCKEINEKGIDIIIIDHHICDKKNPYAIIVNNQNCDYSNKNLSGVGIVYKFLQALDEETWNNYSDNFLDLVALGNIADSMTMTEYETKRLVDKGLNKIRNKFFKALIEKQSYSIGNNFNILAVQFYIAPLINGMIRSGDYDEKDLMFRAFIETDEMFKYKKRGETNEIDEDIYTRCARLCANAKQRQNNSKDKSIIEINNQITEKGYDKNKIIVCNVTDILDETMTGVTAMKIAEQYNRPCLLFRKKKDNKDIYGGSGRNIDNSPINSLKNFLDSLNIFDLVSGHDNAFGIEIKKENIPIVIDLINEKLKDIDFSQCYESDFILNHNELDISFIKDIDDLKDYYATGFKEPYVVIENINLSRKDINLIGKESNTLKFIDTNGITYIKFKLKDDEPIKQWIDDSWGDNNELNLTIVGRCNFNDYGGKLTPQVMICDYNINKE